MEKIFDFEIFNLKYVSKHSESIPTKNKFDQKFLTLAFLAQKSCFLKFFGQKNFFEKKSFFHDRFKNFISKILSYKTHIFLESSQSSRFGGPNGPAPGADLSGSAIGVTSIGLQGGLRVPEPGLTNNDISFILLGDFTENLSSTCFKSKFAVQGPGPTKSKIRHWVSPSVGNISRGKSKKRCVFFNLLIT